MQSLESILQKSSKHHKLLCPRQVLAARMSLLAGELLGLELPRSDKRLLVIAETDGCTVDGIVAAPGCHMGGRTLRILDLGKVAATFVETYTEDAIRVVPGIEPINTNRTDFWIHRLAKAFTFSLESNLNIDKNRST